MVKERQITFAPYGHILTNINVWSPDSRRIVYDVRSDLSGASFDGDRIETVDAVTGEVKTLYTSQHGAKCGVVTFAPKQDRVVFILGPEFPTPDFTYGAARRQGVIVDEDRPNQKINLDARDLVPPFTLGALRGGSHVHVFHSDGEAVSFTYEDHVLSDVRHESEVREVNLRNVGISLLGKPVLVNRDHPRNHDGVAFSVVVTRTVAQPKPGSDEIKKAYEEGWIDRRTLAFLGDTVDELGRTVPEVFVVNLPDDCSFSGDRPLQGTEDLRPAPPRGTTQRRLTWTPYSECPKMPRFWVRPSPDGSVIAYLRAVDNIPQLWTVPVNGGAPTQITYSAEGVRSAFTWSPDGSRIAYSDSRAVQLVDIHTGKQISISSEEQENIIRPEAVVFSPDGQHVAFVKTIADYNQIFIADVPE